MKEIIACPRCGKKLELPEDGLGREVQCPACFQTFEGRPQTASPRPPSSHSAAIPPVAPPASLNRSWSADSSARTLGQSEMAPHRGGMILTFGFLSLLPCVIVSLIFGMLAWTMAETDIKEMRAGYMNPEGESATYVGRVLGLVGIVIWSLVYAFACLGAIR